jgi:hypothetical protein
MAGLLRPVMVLSLLVASRDVPPQRAYTKYDTSFHNLLFLTLVPEVVPRTSRPALENCRYLAES